MGANDGNLKQLTCSEEGMFLRFLFVEILVTQAPQPGQQWLTVS